MPVCYYVYCRSPFADAEPTCPRCGFPRDRSSLQDPAFLAATPVEGLPPKIIDMHQILPAVDGVVEMQLGAMAHFGIDKALLQSVPPPVTSLLGNDKLRQLAATHGERFWASQFLDPRMDGAAAALEQVAGAGVKVVKLLPPTGFAPDDPAFDGFWEAMQRLGLVAMAHTGFITARHKHEEAKAGVFMSSRPADPLHWDRTARKFPQLQIILCHLGGSVFYEAAAEMVTQHDNVWGDLSGSGLFALERLLAVGARFDWSKVFWGNDSPPFAYPFNLRLHLAALAEGGAGDLAPRLLHDNARRFSERHLAA